MDFLIATVLAILITFLYFRACVWASHLWEMKQFREMATVACPNCSRVAGLDSIKKGSDCSPWEELWDGLVHCRPTYRRVTCEGCGQCFVIRLNRDGQRFGPRLSINPFASSTVVGDKSATPLLNPTPPESNPEATWVVYRQDANGNRFVVQTRLSREEAERMVAVFEAKGHQQVYWAVPKQG